MPQVYKNEIRCPSLTFISFSSPYFSINPRLSKRHYRIKVQSQKVFNHFFFRFIRYFGQNTPFWQKKIEMLNIKGICSLFFAPKSFSRNYALFSNRLIIINPPDFHTCTWYQLWLNYAFQKDLFSQNRFNFCLRS